MTRSQHYYLGANSGKGFQSLFDRFAQPELYHDLIVLKGGPGCGKSTMMKRMGAAMEEAGLQVEYLHCSGDPDSLDGVYVPEIRSAILDGTAPHVVEPRFPAAADRYVNLGDFYDVDAAKAGRAEIMHHSGACSAAYRAAYLALGAAAQLAENTAQLAVENFDESRLLRRADGIINRELRGRGDGRADGYRFLGSVTWKGEVWRFDTVEQLCPRVYELQDTYGLAAGFLARIHEAARSRGYGAILCPDAENMCRLQHVLFPELGLAFVTSRDGMRYHGESFRRIRVDALLAGEGFSAARSRLRIMEKLQRSLREEGIRSLREAKENHDRLEAVYRPHVDFAGIDALTNREISRWLSWL